VNAMDASVPIKIDFTYFDLIKTSDKLFLRKSPQKQNVRNFLK